MHRYASLLLPAAALAAPLLLLCGCTTDLGSFPLLATKAVDLTNINTPAASNIPKVSGEDATYQWFYLGDMPSLKTATDHAEDKGDGVALANAHVEADTWNALVVNQFKFVVTGNPLSK
ncbi:MAG: hypothetical protein ABSB74_09840 [Tepidisphaeraceae bacterium]